MSPLLSTLGQMEVSWLGMLFGLTGIGTITAVVVKFVRSPRGFR